MNAETEAYAVGYWMGRAIGSDEGWAVETERHGWDTHGDERDAFKTGYERGVSDYIDHDENPDGLAGDEADYFLRFNG